MNTQVIELVLLKAKEGADATKFKKAIIDLTDFAAEQEGFVARELSQSTEDPRQWIDIVHWENLEFAKAAADKAFTSPICQPAFELIDEQSMQMMHGHVIHKK